MDKIEFDYKLQKIEHEYIMQKNALYRKYALSNNTVKIDNVVTDHIGSIKVGSIKFYLNSNRVPMCIYCGPKYTKKGKPFKNGKLREVYQKNLKINK